MAERFGGRFSPGRSDAPRKPAWRRQRGAGRLNLMSAAAVVMMLFAFGKDPAGLAAGLAGRGLILGAAYTTRQGLVAEAAYHARSIARRPALPRKILGAALTGLGLALPGLVAGTPVAAILFAVLGAGLHLASFGLDPMADKGAAGASPQQSDRVARAVDEAETYLTEMRQAIAGLRDRALADRVAAFQDAARDMFRMVEADPRELSGVRRWLGVYLAGARDASAKFAELYERRRDPAARADYLALLDDLEKGFAERTQKLMIADRRDLDLEIDVLRERLAREGVGGE